MTGTRTIELRNLDIFDNLFEAKPDKRPQGAIFLRDEAKRGHSNIQVMRNRIGSIGWNAIWAELVKSLAIKNNVILFEPYPPDLDKPDNVTVKEARIVVSGGDADVTGNVAGRYIGCTPNVIESGHNAAQIAKMVADWQAKFRAPALTLEQRVERLEKLAGLLP